METGVNFSLPGPASGYACAPEDRSDEADTDNDLSMLPSDFEPGESDVICQRGKDSFEHVGNKIFRELIDKHIASYLDAASRHEKSTIVAKIYDRIRHNALKPSTGFVRKDLLTRRWFVVNEKEARDKVGQALRDAIKIIRSSSRKAKSGTAGLKDSNTTSSSIESTLRSRDISRKRSISSIDSEKLDVSGTASQNGNTVCGIQLEKVEGNTSYAMVPGNLENQAQGVGSQPSIKQNRLDDFERHTMSKMLESSIEPLETSNVHERNFPSADSCMFANAFASKRLDTPCDFLQDSHTQSQLSRQLTSNHGIAENVERRIPKQDQSSEWQLRMNDPFGSALFLPVIGADTSLVSPPQCDQNARQSAHKRHTAAGPWDLEPTPLNVPPARRENSNDQRAAALARLLFHEESYL